MVSRVMQVLIALTFLRQLMLVDIRVDPVQQVLPEMERNVLVGALHYKSCVSTSRRFFFKILTFPLSFFREIMPSSKRQFDGLLWALLVY